MRGAATRLGDVLLLFRCLTIFAAGFATGFAAGLTAAGLATRFAALRVVLLLLLLLLRGKGAECRLGGAAGADVVECLFFGDVERRF